MTLTAEDIDNEIADWGKTNIRIVVALVEFVSAHMSFGIYETVGEVIDKLLTDEQRSDCERHGCRSISDLDFGKLSRVITRYYARFAEDPPRLKECLNKVKDHRNTFSHLTVSTQVSEIAGWRLDVYELSKALGNCSLEGYVETSLVEHTVSGNATRDSNTGVDAARRDALVQKMAVSRNKVSFSRSLPIRTCFDDFFHQTAVTRGDRSVIFASSDCSCIANAFMSEVHNVPGYIIYEDSEYYDLTEFYFSIASVFEQSHGVRFVDAFLRHLPEQIEYSIDVLSSLIRTISSPNKFELNSSFVISVPDNVLFYELDSLMTVSRTSIASMKLLIIGSKNALKQSMELSNYRSLEVNWENYISAFDFRTNDDETRRAIETFEIINTLNSRSKLCLSELELLCNLVDNKVVHQSNLFEWLPSDSDTCWGSHVWRIMTNGQRSYIRTKLQSNNVSKVESYQVLDTLGFTVHFMSHRNAMTGFINQSKS